MKRSLPRKFNPGLNQDDQSLVNQFVVRQHLLQECLDIIRGNTGSNSNIHRLYYAPRGRGKTMLMARIEVAVAQEVELNRNWLVLRLYEENYYEIASAGELWLSVIRQLSLTKVEAELQQSARAAYEDLASRDGGSSFDAAAYAVMSELLGQLQKRVVLIVENLQDLDEELSDDAGWAIRKVLQNEPKIMFIATATSYFSSLLEAKHAFFELFDSREIPALNRTECTTLWNHITGDEREELQVRPLQILTGGSPRLLNVMAQFGKHLSISELMEDLTGLIDERTDYFKSQIESLPSKERRVFVALADLWRPSTAAEIAERARQPVPKVSALLNRLEGRGALLVDASQPRRKRYSIAERLFCIYYKLRSQRQDASVAEALVDFMAEFYPLEIRKKLREEILIHPAFVSLRANIDESLGLVGSAYFLQFENFHSGSKASARALAKQVENTEWVFELKETDSPERAAQSMLGRANALWEQGDIDVALKDYESFIERFDDAEEVALREQVAFAMAVRAITLGEQGDIDGELVGYERLIERFDEAEEVVLQELVAQAMAARAITLGEQGEIDDALMGYERLIERFGEAQEAVLQEHVARAMYYRASTLGEQGDIDGELMGYERLIERFDEAEEVALQEPLAQAMVNRAFTLRQQGDPDGELSGYDAVIERFGEVEELALQVPLAQAMFIRAITLGQQGDPAGALSGYDAVIERFGEAEELTLQEPLAQAMLIRAITLGQKGELEGALSGYDAVIERFGETEELALQEQVARAMFCRASALGQQGDLEGALSDYDAVIERFGEAEALALQDQLAKAMFNRASALGQQGDLDGALSDYDAVIERFGRAKELTLRESAARAMVGRAVTLGQQGDLEGALLGYETVIEHFGEAEELALQELLAKAMAIRAIILAQLEDLEGALSGFEAVIEHFEEAEELAFQEPLAKAMVHRAITLGRQGDLEGELLGYEVVLNRFGDRREVRLMPVLAQTRVNQILVLGLQSDWDRMAQASHQLVNEHDLCELPESSVFLQSVNLLKLTVDYCKTEEVDLGPVSRLCGLAVRSEDRSEERLQLALGVAALLPSKVALAVIEASGAADALKPIVTFLKLQSGEEVHEPQEVLEVVEDIASRVESLRETLCSAD